MLKECDGRDRVLTLLRLATRLVAIVVAALGLVAFGGSPAARVYRDASFGFIVTYPKTFRVAPVDYTTRPPNQSRSGAAFGNVPHPERLVHGSPSTLGDRAVVLLVEHGAGGPPLLLPASGHDTKLPLARASFRPIPGTRLVDAFFVGNGWNLTARIWIGPRASTADRHAVWKMVRSLHMRPLRSGEMTGEAPYVVAGQADSIPIASVTKVGGSLLVHAPHGFYALAVQYQSCEVTFTLPVAFSCPDGRRWDRMGRPLWSNASLNDALSFAPTVAAGDGHVLVAKNAEVSANPADVERQVWG